MWGGLGDRSRKGGGRLSNPKLSLKEKKDKPELSQAVV